MTSASRLAAAAKTLLGLTPREFAAAHKSLARFDKFVAMVVTKDGLQMKLEWWQRLVLLAYFAGFSEILIVIPKGNGKTTLLASLAVYHLLTTPYPQAFIGASNKEQAGIMYEEARRISQLHAAWRRRLIPRQSTKRIYVGKGGKGGFLRVLSSDRLKAEGGDDDEGRGTLEGIEPTLGLVDELQAHVNDAIYAAIQGALHKREGQLLTISTAGFDLRSLLKRMRDGALKFRDKIVDQRFTVARREGFVMFEWALHDRDDVEDMAVVKLANPSSFVTKKKLKALRNSPAMTSSRWAVRHCNLWGQSEGAYFDAELWDARGNEDLVIPDGVQVILGYDHARSYDHAVLVALQVIDIGGELVPIEKWDPEQHEGGRARLMPVEHWIPSEQDGGRVPYWRIKKGMRDACARFDVAGIGFDKLGGFSQSAEELADEGLPMIEVSMKSNVWAPLTSELYAAVKGGRVEHDDDDRLRAHVLAAETKDSEYGERLHGKPKSGAKVDGAMAWGCAWFAAFFTDALRAESFDPNHYRIEHV
jgi:phage terminase large subunit-like protein